MVSNALFYQVHMRLNETFQCESNITFAGLPVLISGNFQQLPPVAGLSIYTSASSMEGYLGSNLWINFRMTQLTEVMRQRGYNNFISQFNKIRKGEIDSKVEKALISRFINKNDLSYPTYRVHIFPENNLVGQQNRERLNELDKPLYTINVIDKICAEIKLSQSQIQAINARKISNTGNLACKLKMKN